MHACVHTCVSQELMKRQALSLKEIEEGYMGRFGKKKVKGEMMYLSQKNSNLKKEKKKKRADQKKNKHQKLL